MVTALCGRNLRGGGTGSIAASSDVVEEPDVDDEFDEIVDEAAEISLMVGEGGAGVEGKVGALCTLSCRPPAPGSKGGGSDGDGRDILRVWEVRDGPGGRGKDKKLCRVVGIWRDFLFWIAVFLSGLVQFVAAEMTRDREKAAPKRSRSKLYYIV